MIQHREVGSTAATPAARFIGALFGVCFMAAGGTAVFMLWNMADALPLLLRTLMSLIPLAFVILGGAIMITSLMGRRVSTGTSSTQDVELQSEEPSSSAPVYRCPKCGAPLSEGADVSPLGDVKCTHCGGWFNIHGKEA